MARRVPRFAEIVASLYLAWSLLVYFGTMGRDGHSWWPTFLYPLIWPLSAFYEWAGALVMRWLYPDPHTVPEAAYILQDQIFGGLYIVVGTLWVWAIARLVARCALRWRR